MIGRTLTAKEAAEILSVSKSTLDRLCKTGRLHPVMIGRRRRFAEDELAAMLGVKVLPDPESEEEELLERPDTGEDRQEICRGLLHAFQFTRYYADLESLEFTRENRRETVTATFANGVTTDIDVTGDSGIGMIKSITRGLSQW